MVCSLVSPAFAAGGQTGILSGTVTDTNQKPIANASISAASPTGSYSATTNAQGMFTVVGVNVDTYVISVSAPGYDTYVLRGATVTGDQTLTLPLTLSKAAAVIGRVGARSATGAFQPNQTVDSYTISGARLQQTTGSPADQNLSDVVLAAPGVQLSSNRLPIIRGGNQREIGYQLDGVPFDEPFWGANGTNGFFNGLNSVQVVEGVGDASQGGLGSGVINVIPKRGTYPGSGDITLQLGSPNFNNFAGIDYGFATPNGKISNYLSVSYNRYAPYYGFHNQDAGSYGNFFGISMRNVSQVADNFVFKFGPNNNQSLQVLYENFSQIDHGNLGGLPPGTFPSDPFALAYYPFDPISQFPFNVLGLSSVSLAPYTPTTNVPITVPEINTSIQTRFLKIEYDNSIDPATYLALRYFNWEQLNYGQQLYSLSPSAAAGSLAIWQDTGGPETGVSFDLTHSFSDKLTVTLNGSYSVVHPIWDAVEPFLSVLSPLFGDFLAPSAPCAGIAAGAGYVSCAYGTGTVLAPAFGLNENGSFFQNWGLGLRFQYAVSNRLHADFGFRYEGQNENWFNPIGNPSGINNPFDVPPALWSAATVYPKVWSPRIALNWQLDPNDAVRASYGRSAVFLNAVTAGTPMGLYGNLAPLAKLPPNIVGLTPVLPGQPVANQCGLAIAVLFPCANYLQQFYWSLDRNFDGPDAGGAQPAIYNNYDASFSHQFGPGGVAVKITPFYKLGTSLPTGTELLALQGGQTVFEESAQGFSRTTGVEFNVTTPEHPVGFSGFLSANYQNVLQSTPPGSNGEFNGAAQLSQATLSLHDVYRAGYVQPASVRIGGTYNFKNGFSITPVIQIDSGFPYNEGDTIANGGPTSLSPGCNTQPLANYPQVNFGCGAPFLTGIQFNSGPTLNTNYYDPAYSGTALAPNISATRGTPTSSNSGGVTWSPNVALNITLQYRHNRDTLGVEFVNVASNGYNGTTPAVNPFYQPVANGVSGPQTGQNTCAAQYGGARGCQALPTNTYAYSNGAYLLTNGNNPIWQIAPLAPMSVNFFYRRQL